MKVWCSSDLPFGGSPRAELDLPARVQRPDRPNVDCIASSGGRLPVRSSQSYRQLFADEQRSRRSSSPRKRSSMADAAYPPGGIAKLLDRVRQQAYGPICGWNQIVLDRIEDQRQSERSRETPERTMGSSISGMTRPVMGPVMPQKFRIDRDGCGRVRIAGRA